MHPPSPTLARTSTKSPIATRSSVAFRPVNFSSRTVSPNPACDPRSPILAMIPSGKGFWQITVSAANLNYPVQWKSDLWLAVPFSAYAKGSLLLGRSRSSAR
jgi:hypothetical protein